MRRNGRYHKNSPLRNKDYRLKELVKQLKAKEKKNEADISQNY